MFVIAHHFVHQPEAFWKSAPQIIGKIPSSLKLHSVFPSKDGKTGTCLWEGGRVSDVQEFLDTNLGSLAKNVCYEVNGESAMNLPQESLQAAYS